MLFSSFRFRDGDRAAARRRAGRYSSVHTSTTPAALESLETRRLLAADPGPAAAINAGVLEVTGTRRADDIHVELNATSGQVDVTINGTPAGSFAPADLPGGLHVDGGAGNDAIVVGSTITFATVLRGGKGNDSITGGGGADDVDGEAGKDTVDGAAGDDNVHGGAGNDNVSGGGDDDTVRGDAGRDTVRGGDGADDLDGGAGNDDCDGEAGDDRVTGERGRDRARGGAGDDTVDGGAGNDDVGGDDGNDVVTGGDGRDKCDGGAGDDSVDGNRGRDRVHGGDGADDFGDAFDADHDREDEVDDRGADDGALVTTDQLPAAVESAFNAQFPGATIREIERETEDVGVVYKIDFLNAQSQRQRAVFTEAGTFVGQEDRDAALTVGAGNQRLGDDDGTPDQGPGDNGGAGAGDDGEQVAIDQIPAAVKSSFDTRFPGVTVREVEREVEHGAVVFKIDFTNSQGQRFRAEFTDAGQFIRQTARGNDDSGGDDDAGTDDNGGSGSGSSGSGSGGGDDTGGDDNGGSGSGSSGSGSDDSGGSSGGGSGNSGSGSPGGGGTDNAPGDDHGGGHG